MSWRENDYTEFKTEKKANLKHFPVFPWNQGNSQIIKNGKLWMVMTSYVLKGHCIKKTTLTYVYKPNYTWDFVGWNLGMTSKPLPSPNLFSNPTNSWLVSSLPSPLAFIEHHKSVLFGSSCHIRWYFFCCLLDRNIKSEDCQRTDWDSFRALHRYALCIDIFNLQNGE